MNTRKIKRPIDPLIKLNDYPLFRERRFIFFDGTALAYFLNHRISYDLDFLSPHKLDPFSIKTTMARMGAEFLPYADAAQFRINTGEDLENYFLRFSLDGVKIEFSHFKDPVIAAIVEDAPLSRIGEIDVFEPEALAKLKAASLFRRKKVRDLFDVFVCIDKGLVTFEEINRIFSYYGHGNSLKAYLTDFSPDMSEADNTLAFESGQEYEKIFAGLTPHKTVEKLKKAILLLYEDELDRFKKKRKIEFRGDRLVYRRDLFATPIFWNSPEGRLIDIETVKENVEKFGNDFDRAVMEKAMDRAIACSSS